MRRSLEQRLAFVEARLFWFGSINRTDIVRRFGVSTSQASADMGRYLARQPEGVRYDRAAKRYVAEESFRPILAEPSSGAVLGELRLVHSGLITEADTLLGERLPVDTTPVPERPVEAFMLRAVIRAIRVRRALDITYQSMSRPEPLRRIVEPHALANDGFRWHARAHDRESGTFRDFVLGRIASAAAAGPARSTGLEDADWQSLVPLVIAPHPELTASQARAIASDYGINGASVTIEVRRALLFYALRRLGLDVPADARRPSEQHIVLLNRAEVEGALPRAAET